MTVRSGQKDGPGRRGIPLLSRILALAFGCCLAGIAVGTGLDLLSRTPEGEHFRAGREAFETGRMDEARDHFLAELQDGRSFFAGAAYHNLGLISLQEAMAEGGANPMASAQDAIRYLEESLVLEPGVEETAWNLELALRQVARLAASRGPEPDPTAGQQPGAAPADTRGEGIQEPAASSAGGRDTDQNPSVDDARRLLASFRLMEKSSSREALRSLMHSGSGKVSLERRGPPW